jgi:hypothetical protein
MNADQTMGAAAWASKYQFIAVKKAGGGCKANDAHPMDANDRQIATAPAALSGSEGDIRREALRIRVLVKLT